MAFDGKPFACYKIVFPTHSNLDACVADSDFLRLNDTIKSSSLTSVTFLSGQRKRYFPQMFLSTIITSSFVAMWISFSPPMNLSSRNTNAERRTRSGAGFGIRERRGRDGSCVNLCSTKSRTSWIVESGMRFTVIKFSVVIIICDEILRAYQVFPICASN